MDRKRFSSLKLSADSLAVVQALGFEFMTPIQAETIPLLLDGKDVIGQSETGSGKTAAFTLPILERILIDQKRSNRKIQAMILCPTRELCAQVTREVRKLGRKKIGLQVLELAGGSPVGPQARLLEQGVHWVVGTPGRVLDHLQRQNLDLSFVRTVVLDEADRMLEMGFQEEMEAILGALPEERQTVLFSATFPKGIERMSSRFQKAAEMIKIQPDAAAETPQNQAVEQVLYEMESLEDKPEILLQILAKDQPESAIVFCNQKATTFEVERDLNRLARESGGGKEAISCAVLNGDLEQRERDLVMAKFRNQSIRILIATDVAARGIDVADLDLVINYDLPQKPEVYTHRIGRTGRAGKKGKAISLILSREKNKPWVQESIVNGAQVEPFKKGKPESFTLAAKMDTLLIFEGRKNKMRPGDILGALTGEAGGLKGTDIGKIEIHDFYAYVAVAKTVSSLALERLQNGRIKGKKVRVERPNR